MDLPLDCCSGSGEALVDLPRCARRGFRCAPRLQRAPQSGDAHSKRATGATCPFGTNGVPIRAVASRPLWIPRRESTCDPALRAGTLSGAAFGGKNHERVPPRAGFGFPPCGRTAFFAPLRGAPNVPPAAAEIAGSRPGRRADFLRAQEVGGRRALKGTSALGGLPGLRPERATRDGRSPA